MNRHAHTEYLKRIEVYSPLGIWHVFFYIVLTPISTTSGLWSTGNTRKYHQIDVYIYQCEVRALQAVAVNERLFFLKSSVCLFLKLYVPVNNLAMSGLFLD